MPPTSRNFYEQRIKFWHFCDPTAVIMGSTDMDWISEFRRCAMPLVIRIYWLLTQEEFIASVMLILCVVGTLCARLTLMCGRACLSACFSSRTAGQILFKFGMWTVWNPKLFLFSFVQHNGSKNLCCGSHSTLKLCMVTVFEKLMTIKWRLHEICIYFFGLRAMADGLLETGMWNLAGLRILLCSLSNPN
jgi:hypothetical protein